MLILQPKRHLLMMDLVAAFVLFIFMLVILFRCVFLCRYRFSVKKDLYKKTFLNDKKTLCKNMSFASVMQTVVR